MTSAVSYAELLKMSAKDLHAEIRTGELESQKMRMGITMGREKDTARYQRSRRQLARMKTALTAKMGEDALKKPMKKATLSAPSAEKKEGPKKAPARKTTKKTSASNS